MTDIDNKHRSASWESVAREMQSERDAVRSEVLRLTQEVWLRDAEIERLRAEVAQLNRRMRDLSKLAERAYTLHDDETIRLRAEVEAALRLSQDSIADADRLRAENVRLREALTELIRLKDQKLLIETQIQAANDGGYCRSAAEVRLELDYNERKPKAWEQACAALAAPTEQGNG